jgi:phosphoribosylanthranilate isomerase
MIDFITRLFRTEPGAKIRKIISQKQTQAVQLQRNGKLREYAKIMKEIEALEDEYIEAVNESR